MGDQRLEAGASFRRREAAVPSLQARSPEHEGGLVVLIEATERPPPPLSLVHGTERVAHGLVGQDLQLAVHRELDLEPAVEDRVAESRRSSRRATVW